MTERQTAFFAWMLAELTDRCETVEEVRRMNAEIRRQAGIEARETHGKGRAG